jgi:hypothetical protein
LSAFSASVNQLTNNRTPRTDRYLNVQDRRHRKYTENEDLNGLPTTLGLVSAPLDRADKTKLRGFVVDKVMTLSQINRPRHVGRVFPPIPLARIRLMAADPSLYSVALKSRRRRGNIGPDVLLDTINELPPVAPFTEESGVLRIRLLFRGSACCATPS